jgi:hypothetical protein
MPRGRGDPGLLMEFPNAQNSSLRRSVSMVDLSTALCRSSHLWQTPSRSASPSLCLGSGSRGRTNGSAAT